MARQLLVPLVIAAIGYCAVSASCTAQAPDQSPSVVKQIDHILIESSEARELFTLLSDTLQFPVVWPLSDYGSFASGGVALGNVNLEILKAADSTVKSRFVGFALEPKPLRTVLTELKARRIPHGLPSPFRSRQPNGSMTTLWTTVGLPDISSDGVNVFFCEYGHNVLAQRRRLDEQLKSRDGGPLSAHSVREVVVGIRDVKRIQVHWQTLLNPLEVSSQRVWSVGTGPAIRLIQADKDEIRGLVVNVTSMQQARRFLKAHGLLDSEQSATITLAGSQLKGLNITLVEQRSKGS